MAAASKQQLQLEDILPDINTRYAYVLAYKNDVRNNVYDENGKRRGEPVYQPSVNIMFKSFIIWPGGTDPFSKKERAKGTHQLRYYDGCTTLFMDDQPKEKESVDALISASRDANFVDGYYYVYGYETMLKLYMDWASYNEDSPYRKPSATVKWKNVNTEKQIEEEGKKLELEDKASDMAKTAPLKKMKIHAKYLGISLVDNITNNELSEKGLRIEYRKEAKKDAKGFIDSYNDKSLEVKTWITDAIATGKISSTLLPNKAVWTKGGAVIADISGVKAPELVIEKLVEFSQTDDGTDFIVQLKALYD